MTTDKEQNSMTLGAGEPRTGSLNLLGPSPSRAMTRPAILPLTAADPTSDAGSIPAGSKCGPDLVSTARGEVVRGNRQATTGVRRERSELVDPGNSANHKRQRLQRCPADGRLKTAEAGPAGAWEQNPAHLDTPQQRRGGIETDSKAAVCSAARPQGEVLGSRPLQEGVPEGSSPHVPGQPRMAGRARGGMWEKIRRWYCHKFHRWGWPVMGHVCCMDCGREYPVPQMKGRT